MTSRLNILNVISLLFGVLVFAIGIVNTFWGNDTGFGIFLLLLSLVYFPPATELLRQKTGLTIPVAVKVVLGLFLLWAALGVGELFNKIELMLNSL